MSGDCLVAWEYVDTNEIAQGYGEGISDQVWSATKPNNEPPATTAQLKWIVVMS